MVVMVVATSLRLGRSRSLFFLRERRRGGGGGGGGLTDGETVAVVKNILGPDRDACCVVILRFC